MGCYKKKIIKGRGEVTILCVSLTQNKQRHSIIMTTLVPLRVDVSSNTGIRIVDTILLDPSCWPIPLTSPVRDAVEENALELANNILSDAEVIGMGRTIRHFTGRVDLFQQSLRDSLIDQLRPQLYKVLQDMKHLPVVLIQPTKRTIHLFINTHGVLIKDSFDWDTSVDLSPITFANQMVADLNLPDEASVAIATAILEQLYGVETNITSSGNIKHQQEITSPSVKEIDPKDQANNISHVLGFYK